MKSSNYSYKVEHLLLCLLYCYKYYNDKFIMTNAKLST